MAYFRVTRQSKGSSWYLELHTLPQIDCLRSCTYKKRLHFIENITFTKLFTSSIYVLEIIFFSRGKQEICYLIWFIFNAGNQKFSARGIYWSISNSICIDRKCKYYLITEIRGNLKAEEIIESLCILMAT